MIKKTITVILCLCLLALSGCVQKTVDMDGISTLTSLTSQTSESPSNTTTEAPTVTDPTVKPITAGSIPLNKKAIYGANTGTDKTYTGYEPLPAREFKVTDPDNTRGLSTTANVHSFGVAKNGEPHTISVEKQKYYSQYGALTLDTSGNKVIYLTFDCGYEGGYTEKILDILKEKGVPAAFFVTLPYLKSSPEIAARMIKEGHTVGNHSATHPNFSTISRTKMVQELQLTDDYLRLHFGYSSPYFRFPEGACSDCSLELVASLGYTSVFWSAAYSDWDTSKQKGKDYAFTTVTSRLHPGCVLLLHSQSTDNVSALGDIIDYAINNGYTFSPLG